MGLSVVCSVEMLWLYRESSIRGEVVVREVVVKKRGRCVGLF